MGIEVENGFLFKDSVEVKEYEDGISSPLTKIQIDGEGDFEIEILAKSHDDCNYVTLAGIDNYDFSILTYINKSGIFTFDTLGYRKLKVNVKKVTSPITCNIIYCDEC